MPYDPAMPLTPRRLFDQQAGDFQAIQGYMKRAGITTHDLTGMFEED
jgi:hypothetical protein